MGSKAETLREKIKPVVEREDLELVDLEFSRGGPESVLRVYVDRSTGVTVDQCASLSRQISDLLDMEDLIPGRYKLEVSSPGLDRPLVSGADFKRKIGEKVRVFLKENLDGKTELVGEIRDLKEENVVLRLESTGPKQKTGEERIVPLKMVAKARILF
ncbi:MAG: ribosome maturation factor RimP [Candidatus Zixiibacteriota bacterium]|nr:MAG: ribosome maturation factor RimP [candidate division Zixibacteria bacterium]